MGDISYGTESSYCQSMRVELPRLHTSETSPTMFVAIGTREKPMTAVGKMNRPPVTAYARADETTVMVW